MNNIIDRLQAFPFGKELPGVNGAFAAIAVIAVITIDILLRG